MLFAGERRHRRGADQIKTGRHDGDSEEVECATCTEYERRRYYANGLNRDREVDLLMIQKEECYGHQ